VKLNELVATRTPLRVSFFGGGTDLPQFYQASDGAVLSVGIEQSVYVVVKRHSSLFAEKYRIQYYETEHVNELDEIRNGIVRECLRLVYPNESVLVSTYSDVPAESGLGSSSSFAVGLLNALHLLKGERVSPVQLAEEACHVEIETLHKTIGKQDQYAAAFGGMNGFQFRRSGVVDTTPIPVTERLLELFDSLTVVWTGFQRSAEAVLENQVSAMPQQRDKWVTMRDLALEVTHRARENNLSIDYFSDALNKSWELKRQLSADISTEAIDDLMRLGFSAGARAAKLLGAGNGGFVLFVVPPANRTDFEATLEGFSVNRMMVSQFGSRALFGG